MKLSSFRYGWSIAYRRCSNYIFILDLTPGFFGLGKDNCKTRRETFNFENFGASHIRGFMVLTVDSPYPAAEFFFFMMTSLSLGAGNSPVTSEFPSQRPWLISCLWDAIRKKNTFYYKSIKIKCIRTKKMYEDYRNQLRKLIKAVEKKYHTDRILENKQNCKKTSGQLSKALLIEIRRLSFKKNLNWMMAHILQIWK